MWWWSEKKRDSGSLTCAARLCTHTSSHGVNPPPLPVPPPPPPASQHLYGGRRRQTCQWITLSCPAFLACYLSHLLPLSILLSHHHGSKQLGGYSFITATRLILLPILFLPLIYLYAHLSSFSASACAHLLHLHLSSLPQTFHTSVVHLEGRCFLHKLATCVCPRDLTTTPCCLFAFAPLYVILEGGSGSEA